MKAAILRGARSIDLVEVKEPALRRGRVTVEIDRCAIGGSDLLAWTTGELPAAAWFGHAWSGRVVALGDDVPGRFVGERVVGAAPPPCGSCKHCRAGFGHNCDLVLEMIIGVDPLASGHGAFSERIGVDSRRVHRIPEGIDQDDAALAEPASVAAHAVARSEIGLGDLVVVIGAGTIGLIVAELARVAGASRVVAVDPVAQRRELACDLGSDAAFAPGAGVARWLQERGHGLGADVAFDCIGAPSALGEAVNLVRRGGTVMAVGVSGQTLAAVPADLVRREVTVRASLGYTTADVQRVLELLAEDRLRVSPLRSAELISLNQIDAAMQELVDNPSGGLSVLVKPPSGA